MEKAIKAGLIIFLICFTLLPLASCGEGETVDRTVELGSNTEKICDPESRDCNENDVVKCNSAGDEWVFFKQCEEGQICEEGDCIDEEGDGDEENEQN